MMNQRQSDIQSREEFFNEMQGRLGDEVLELEMVCFEAEKDVFAALNLKPQKDGLWGLLIMCKHSLHFYVHPSESPFAVLFRTASNGKPPAEQIFSFSAFSRWTVQKIQKRSLFGNAYEKYRLVLKADIEGASVIFYIKTHHSADAVFEKIKSYSF
ncbi:hypothetical protein H0R92_10075 [Treponema sp. OMZ 840]|uniref:hypothetical protein n=1 Tax=Treponema sp. OMZ 840 TaxID=244313 RepID=UPI003D8BD7D4